MASVAPSVLSCLSITNNLVMIALVFLILVVPLFFLLRSSKVGRRRGGKEPPLAAGAWPIIGHLWLFTRSQPPQITLGAMADKYGAIFRIKIGSQRAVVINNWKTAKECFTTNDIALSSRPRVVAVEHLTYNQAIVSFAPYGHYWREMRRIANQELLSTRRIELSRHLRVSELEASIKALYKLWAEKHNNNNDNDASSSGYVAVEMKKWFGELMLSMVLRVVAGKRYFGGSDEEEAQRFLKTMREFMRQLGLVVVGDAVPWLRWLDLGGHEKAMKKTAKEMDAIMVEWLEEHRRKRANSDQDGGDQDFMDVMLSILDGTQLAGFDSDTVIKATTWILMGGSIDTTSGTLIWILSCMLNNTGTIEQAQKELNIYVGKDRLVNETDISKLVYIQAIVKETLRLHPTAIFSGPREFADDCFVNGYHIPKGTQLIINLWKIHTDPSIRSDPLEFKPERFLTTHKDVDVRDAPGAPRQCWFGGGTDLTPAYIFKEDVKHFHSVKRKKSELIVVETRATWRAANDLYSGKWESLQVNQLLDFGFVGYAYTWSNNQVGEANIQERLDRAVAIINWKEAFLEGVVKHFQRYRSDHCPILIDVHGESLKRKRPYIFRSEECGLETLNAKRLSKEAGL